MELVAWMVFGFALLRLLVASINLIFRQPLRKGDVCDKLVTVVVPVRNEASNVGALLGDLCKQTHQKLEILIFDDQSTDETVAIVQHFELEDKRIKLLQSNGLPEGWLGKNHACHTASLYATGDYLLFVDADVRLAPDSVALALERLRCQQLGLLSILPKQETLTCGERVTVPLMNILLLSLLPLILVRKSSWSSFSAANGQFMMFDGFVYRSLKLHERFRLDKVEDLRIAKYLKRQKVRMAFIASVPQVSCRMYRSYQEALTGFSKNIIQIFGGSALLACLYWVVTSFAFIPVLLGLGLDGLFLYLLTVMLMRVLISITSHQPYTENLLYILPQQWSLARIIAMGIWFRWRKMYVWKDRNISL